MKTSSSSNLKLCYTPSYGNVGSFEFGENSKITACKKDSSSSFVPYQISCSPGRKTLVLDLDETLIHSYFYGVQGSDFSVTVNYYYTFSWSKMGSL